MVLSYDFGEIGEDGRIWFARSRSFMKFCISVLFPATTAVVATGLLLSMESSLVIVILPVLRPLRKASSLSSFV